MKLGLKGIPFLVLLWLYTKDRAYLWRILCNEKNTFTCRNLGCAVFISIAGLPFLGLGVQPPLIIADEPTSALDGDLSDETLMALRHAGTVILLVSHDMALLGALCHRS